MMYMYMMYTSIWHSSRPFFHLFGRGSPIRALRRDALILQGSEVQLSLSSQAQGEAAASTAVRVHSYLVPLIDPAPCSAAFERLCWAVSPTSTVIGVAS